MTVSGIEVFERYQYGKAMTAAIVLLLSVVVMISDNFVNAPIGAVGLAIAYIMLRPCTPYFTGGFQLWKVRRITSEADFVPLAVWMVPRAHQEIPQYECEQLKKYRVLHPVAKRKLNEVIECRGKITAYDAVNVQLLNEQLRDG